MKLDEIVADPVLQLNLLLWMTREQPEESYRVRPIFFKAGFDLWDIDATFTLPEAVIAQIQNKNLPVKVNPSPDLRLRNTSQSKALYIEAKKSSFTPESSNSEQARAHLLAAGPLAIENYKPITEIVLAYHTPEDQRAGMDTCLDKLSNELLENGLKTARFSSCGFKVQENSIQYIPGEATAEMLGISAQPVNLIANIDKETDPSPLLLLVVDQDHHDKVRVGAYRYAVQQQVIAVLLGRLHNSMELNSRVTAHELLLETSTGTLAYLPKKKQGQIEKMISDRLFKRMRDAWKEKHPEMIQLEGKEIHFAFDSELRREEFLDWLEDSKKTNFSDKAVSDETPLLPGFEADLNTVRS
jgi:hypothetical protein